MLKKIVLSLIDVYQAYIGTHFISPCRFLPSCSEYAKQAIIKYGLLSGIFRALKRILFCHPFSGKAGFDPLL